MPPPSSGTRSVDRIQFTVWAICVGWIATSNSVAAALPLLVLSFSLLVPMFLFVARETTRKELIDFVGQRT